MNKTIELPVDIFDRLASHANGFDTPTNVIMRLLDFYENPQNKGVADDSNGDIVKQAFKLNFESEPRPFGQKGASVSGYSDDKKGVQWNIVSNKESGTISLGVNLEGMKYKDWPIANLLLNESRQAKLLNLRNIEKAGQILVEMSRDAWQAAARPLIKERHIAPSNLFLSELTDKQWHDIIKEALDCLDKKAGYKGRGHQVVSRIKSNDTKKMDVSPHLTFRIVITDKEPQSIDSFLDDLKEAQNTLAPLYRFALEQIK